MILMYSVAKIKPIRFYDNKSQFDKKHMVGKGLPWKHFERKKISYVQELVRIKI